MERAVSRDIAPLSREDTVSTPEAWLYLASLTFLAFLNYGRRKGFTNIVLIVFSPDYQIMAFRDVLCRKSFIGKCVCLLSVAFLLYCFPFCFLFSYYLLVLELPRPGILSSVFMRGAPVGMCTVQLRAGSRIIQGPAEAFSRCEGGREGERSGRGVEGEGKIWIRNTTSI